MHYAAIANQSVIWFSKLSTSKSLSLRPVIIYITQTGLRCMVNDWSNARKC